jgi:hypothetical protein
MGLGSKAIKIWRVGALILILKYAELSLQAFSGVDRTLEEERVPSVAKLG